MKFCKDCKYCKPEGPINSPNYVWAKCTNNIAKKFDLVTGYLSYNICKDMRHYNGFCGDMGSYFEPKDSEPTA